jgi:hypothetical protein
VASEGGVPITVNGKIIGAIGRSGGTGQQDGLAAAAGASAAKSQAAHRALRGRASDSPGTAKPDRPLALRRASPERAERGTLSRKTSKNPAFSGRWRSRAHDP